MIVVFSLLGGLIYYLSLFCLCDFLFFLVVGGKRWRYKYRWMLHSRIGGIHTFRFFNSDKAGSTLRYALSA